MGIAPMCRRLCFVGTDLYVESAVAARKMGEHINGTGKVASVGVIDPNNAEASVKTRMFFSHLTGNYRGVQATANRGAGKYEIKHRAYEITRKLLDEVPDLAGIYSNADEALEGVVQATVDAGREGEICIVGYGNEPHIMANLSAGRVTYALLHNRFAYGHDAMVHLYNYRAVGLRPPRSRILSNPAAADKETISEFWRPDLGFLVSEETKRYLARPVPSIADRALRFVLLLEGVGPWFSEIVRGAKEAVKQLPGTVADVDNWEIDGLKEEEVERLRTEALERALRNGYDGAVLWVLNDKIVPHINRAVQQGMDVVVIHTEPVSYDAITPEAEEVFASLFREMTLLEYAEQRLRRLSNEDPLTGLCNRRRINERIEEEFLALSRNEGAEMSVLMLDLDHFKKINDDWGHLSGDICLKETAERIRRCIRRSKDTAARWGGEEFVVALPNTDLAGAELIAEEIRCAVASEPVVLPRGKVQLTVSIGAVCTHFGPATRAEGWESLIRRADDALYEAKSRGRNCVVADDRPTFIPEALDGA